MTAAGGNGKDDSFKFDSVSKVIGASLGVAAGIFGFVGISQTEVGSILRNEAWAPSVVALLLALALAAAVASVFLHGSISPWFALGIWVVAIIPMTFMIWALPTPGSSPRTLSAAGWTSLGLCALGAVLLGFGFVRWRRGRDRDRKKLWSLQQVLVVAGGLLLAGCIYSAIRLEARSQYASSSPQLDATIDRTDGSSTLQLTITASRLRATDNVHIYAYERANKDDCTTKLNCIIDATVLADDGGNVHTTIKVPLAARAYSELTIEATSCARDVNDKKSEECKPRGGATMVLDVPAPSTATTTANVGSIPGP
ncbi:MAG TPA: hypothetical protein VGJ03_10230 [Acidimicrobiales bacterium]